MDFSQNWTHLQKPKTKQEGLICKNKFNCSRYCAGRWVTAACSAHRGHHPLPNYFYKFTSPLNWFLPQPVPISQL